MDAGVIKNMKHLYRKEVLRKQIHALEHKIPFQINMKEVVMLIAHAWNLVQRETIQNCFRQSQIETRAEVEMVSEANDKATSGEDMIGLLKSHGVDLPETFSFEEFVEADAHLQTCGIPTDDDIISELLSKNS